LAGFQRLDSENRDMKHKLEQSLAQEKQRAANNKKVIK
jgi:hypothetical protein